MRVLWLIPLIIALIVGAGAAILRLAGSHAHLNAALVAAVITLTASILAIIPLWLTGGLSLPARVQGGLVATFVHMMASAGLVAAEMKFAWGGPFASVLYWILPLYCGTLTVLVIAISRSLRRPHESLKIAPSA